MKKQAGAWKKSCLQVMDRYKLTSREREVFLLLAKGRNAAVIEKKLTVSPSTVKSHIYNIYKKMHISSQQELIDMIEADVQQALKTPQSPNVRIS